MSAPILNVSNLKLLCSFVDAQYVFTCVPVIAIFSYS